MKKSYSQILLLLLLIVASTTAQAQFNLLGECGLVENDNPQLRIYKYALHISWNTGTPYGLSHVDLIVDDGTNCTCDEICVAVKWLSPIGTMIGVPDDCPMDIDLELNCNGDPSIGVNATLFKFEPQESEFCEAGPIGEMTVYFYSDYPPAPIDEPNLFLVDKFATYSDWGLITGFFPALPCGPIKADEKVWGQVKQEYR